MGVRFFGFRHKHAFMHAMASDLTFRFKCSIRLGGVPCPVGWERDGGAMGAEYAGKSISYDMSGMAFIF